MRSTEEIYAALTERLRLESGAAVAEGGELSLRLRTVAAEIFTLESQADYALRQSFPQTAEGASLDRHAQLRGLTRNPARKAVGQLRFSVENPRGTALSIPAGTECRTAAGRAFRTTEAGEIPAGETDCVVAAEAAEPGAGGSVPAGAVCIMVLPPVGVERVCNDEAFHGGSDTERDEALRSRVLAAYHRLPNGANTAYYEGKVLDFPGTAAVRVLPRSRGIGTVDIVFSTTDGVPTAAERTQVQALLDAEREICVDIRVLAPTTAELDVTAELTAAQDRDFAEVSAAAEAVLRTFFTGALLGRPVYRAKLESLLMAVDGVENCRLTAPAADLPGERVTLPVLGTVTISEAV